ncbi:DUF4158 domain-containing protein [Inquilinus sp. OTU3971]|uniref:DUF4158 domain-containing protein n=1 Tax=Inquilinus sp. OTU3971 TaxID=3043855 RepID=UPI00406C17E4
MPRGRLRQAERTARIPGFFWRREDRLARRTLLKPGGYERLLGIPDDEESLIRHYTLSPEDRFEALARRRPWNQLGFAVQLCLMCESAWGPDADRRHKPLRCEASPGSHDGADSQVWAPAPIRRRAACR